MFTGVLPQDVPNVWGFAKPLIARALKYSRGKFRPNDYYPGLLNGSMQLWVNDESAALTEITIYPHRKICNLVACGGANLAHIRRDLAVIEKWAKEKGCDGMRIEGRPGWKATLKDYQMTKVIFEKVL
jgi:hypothetical protein